MLQAFAGMVSAAAVAAGHVSGKYSWLYHIAGWLAASKAFAGMVGAAVKQVCCCCSCC
jgi:hypothetical protein